MHASLSSQIKNVANEKQKTTMKKKHRSPLCFFSPSDASCFFLGWEKPPLPFSSAKHKRQCSCVRSAFILRRFFFFFSSVNEVDMCSFYDSAYIEQLHFIRGRPSLAPLPVKFEETSDAIRHVGLPFNGGGLREARCVNRVTWNAESQSSLTKVFPPSQVPVFVAAQEKG